MNPKDKIGKTKPPLALIPGTALIELAKAFEDGANKYGAFNWRSQPVETMTYCHAGLRHLFSYIDGEELTRDSKVKHLSAVMACCAILLDAEASGTLIDNRPTKGKSADKIDENTQELEPLTCGDCLKILCGIPNCTQCRREANE